MRRSFDVNFGQLSCWSVVAPHMSKMSLAQSLKESEWDCYSRLVGPQNNQPSRNSLTVQPGPCLCLLPRISSVFSWSFSTSLLAGLTLSFRTWLAGWTMFFETIIQLKCLNKKKTPIIYEILKGIWFLWVALEVCSCSMRWTYLDQVVQPLMGWRGV